MSYHWKQRLVLSVAGVMLVVLGFTFGTAATPVSADPQLQDSVPVTDPFLTDAERIFAGVYDNVSPSVVAIEVLTRQESGSQFFDDVILPAGGSGFVIDLDGHVVTNTHVVQDAESIAVRFLDGTLATADIVGMDPDSDIAVIQVQDVPQERLLPVAFADSNTLRVGQATLAIGSPFGEDWTLTSGIISALNRTITGLSDFSIGAVIQTDTAINPGNSGGPLLNLQGEVIGVNSQILSSTRSNSGVGFAVPSNLVARVAGDLIEDGEVNYSYIGISGTDMSLQLIDTFSLPNNLQGAVVRAVVPDSPASNSGLQDPSNNTIDIITAIDGTAIDNMDGLLAYLASRTVPGDTVTMSVYRGGNIVDLSLTLGVRPS